MKKNGTKTIAALALAALVALMAAGCGDDFYNLSSRNAGAGGGEGVALRGRVTAFFDNVNVGAAYDFGTLVLGYADEKEDADYEPGSISWEKVNSHLMFYVTVPGIDTTGFDETDNGPVAGYSITIPVRDTMVIGNIGMITITATWDQPTATGTGRLLFIVAFAP